MMTQENCMKKKLSNIDFYDQYKIASSTAVLISAINTNLINIDFYASHLKTSYQSLTFLVLESTVCPAASANKVSSTFTDNGDIKTLFGIDFKAVCFVVETKREICFSH